MEESRTKGPYKGKDKPCLIERLRRAQWNILWDDQSIQEAAEYLDMADWWDGCNHLELLADNVTADWDVFVKENGEM